MNTPKAQRVPRDAQVLAALSSCGELLGGLDDLTFALGPVGEFARSPAARGVRHAIHNLLSDLIN